MKSHREQLIDELVNLVDDWEIDALIDACKNYMRSYYASISTEELEKEHTEWFGVQDYEHTIYNTFPEEYNES